MPFGLSPGMGLNAYLVYSQVLGADVRVDAALTGCLVAAALVAALAAVRALHVVLAVVPDAIKLATVVGMGLLLTFIGLQGAGIVVADAETMVAVGDLLALKPAIAIAGLAAVTSLSYRNVRGGILIGVLAAALAYFAAAGGWPTRAVDLPHLRVGRLEWAGLVAPPTAGAWNAVAAYALVMVFDIGGAMFGLGNLAGLVEGGRIPGATRAYLAACAGTALGAVTGAVVVVVVVLLLLLLLLLRACQDPPFSHQMLCCQTQPGCGRPHPPAPAPAHLLRTLNKHPHAGTTPVIIAAESAVGIKEGGRTGLVAVVVAGCFALSVFFAPLLQSVPQVATAPVLVLVGAMMMGESHRIDWGDMLTAVPAFLTIVVQPFTFSIANGIYAGLLMSALVHVTSGTAVAAARDVFARLRSGGGGVDGAAQACPACDGAADALDAAEAAAAAAAGSSSASAYARGRRAKDGDGDGALAAPLLGPAGGDGGGGGGGGGGGSASDLASLHGSGAAAPGSVRAPSEAISIARHHHAAGHDGSAGGAAHSHPYERESWGMLINTRGSHAAAGHLAAVAAAHHDGDGEGDAQPPCSPRG